ncbi:putative amine oxidase [copper-containing] [Gigantopelta aegis]|uniref:putative amine oxidase [copper-containing] n=1 Tax=Gigantopelta aegis TaxID=1735272 RepID=UPI001B88ADDA|nr:putative amine oxidase [copper-containing] [Gigantopelta aegis]
MLIVVIVLVVKEYTTTETSGGRVCGGHQTENIDTLDSLNPGPFHDLTQAELRAVHKYIYGLSKLNLVKPSRASMNTSYLYAADLFLPRKEDVLAFLDEGKAQPHRKAKIVVFRGDKQLPVVEEYIVGPLPTPVYCDLYNSTAYRNPVNFSFRPFSKFEFKAVFEFIVPIIDKEIKYILLESYGATFVNCGMKCLTIYPTPVSSGIIGRPERKIWLGIYQNIEYGTLHPTDLSFLVNINSPDPSEMFIEKVVYAGQEFANLTDLAIRYNSSDMVKHTIPFPDYSEDLFSSMHQRGPRIPAESQRPPQLVEPDGKRYSVHNREVRYMQWKFDFRMSVLTGPQVYNVRFKDTRIAYEIGLQDIAVFYSGYSSLARAADFLDSVSILGTRCRALVPGADCPLTATLIGKSFLVESTEDLGYLSNVFCLFEQNLGVPLRRHMSYAQNEGQWYSGMLNSALTLRSIIVISNYDYVIDFNFYQNGAIEVKVHSTGYIFTTFYSQEKHSYGFKMHDNILGNIHQHLFNFKVDIDILGTRNRYETLDISTEEVSNEQTTGNDGDTYWQVKFDHHLRRTELDAAYKFNFDHLKYHLIFNNNKKTSQGVQRAYRILMSGMSKQLLPEDKNNEISISWARYQMAVTKVKDDERQSSSHYGLFDSLLPTVNFTTFVADDDGIVDEDLVLWLTMGLYHIPHTEDLPVTPTVGGNLQFFLLPYNYFDECPSMQSRDAIRVDLKNKRSPKDGLKVTQYVDTTGTHCTVHTDSLQSQFSENPDAVLQTKRPRNEF